MDITSNKDDATVLMSNGGGGDKAASASASPLEDFVASAINTLLAEELFSLPLLPCVLTEQKQWQFRVWGGWYNGGAPVNRGGEIALKAQEGIQE
jgi:hypothetical protein